MVVAMPIQRGKRSPVPASCPRRPFRKAIEMQIHQVSVLQLARCAEDKGLLNESVVLGTGKALRTSLGQERRIRVTYFSMSEQRPHSTRMAI